MKLIFDAGRQRLKVRGVMWFSLLMAVLAARSAVHLARTYGLNPADGGVLAPLSVRLAWAAGVLLLGAGFALGMWLYGRLYVARMEVEADEGRLHVFTVGFLGDRHHVYQVGEVHGGREHAGQSPPPFLVHAPWRELRLAGRRLPLIIDEQGTIHDRRWMQRLFGRGRFGP